MLIGCCMNLLAERNDPTAVSRLRLIAGLGYDYIELPLAPVAALTETKFEALCASVQTAGLPCRSFSNLFPAGLRVTGSGADYDKIRRYLERVVSRARRLGASVIVFGSPASRNVEAGFPREIAMLQFIKVLQILDQYAGGGLRFAIEHVCRLEGNLIYTVRESCQVREVCRAGNIGVLADTYHMSVEGEPIESISLAGEHLLHVHTANPAGRVYPSDGDGVDYKRLMNTLKSIQYQGGISVEAFSKDPAADGREALRVLRRAMA